MATRNETVPERRLVLDSMGKVAQGSRGEGENVFGKGRGEGQIGSGKGRIRRPPLP